MPSQSAADILFLPLIADLPIDQLLWLNNQTSSYSLAQQDDDSNFWPSLFQRFFTLWPVDRGLWPTMPRNTILTEEEQRVVRDGEKRLESYIKAFSELKGILANPDVKGQVGNSTIEQYNWLDDQLDSYISAVLVADLKSFWLSIFSLFFSMWPEREFLWPNMPANQALTGIQLRFVSAAEEQRKRCIKAFFRTHAYTHLANNVTAPL